ncbi:MAG: hypothetical protein IPL28_09575 [Chloroflexi bacterium]|nr:hypothetical protein [Chloroflexota bacterium]
MGGIPRLLALGSCRATGEEAARGHGVFCIGIMRRLLAPTTWRRWGESF